MDNHQDHIEQRIKASFESQEKKAPKGLWSDIATNVDLTDDEAAIKNSFANASVVKAPKNSWGNVKQQLIIDEVWSNILAFQERRRRRAIIWWWSGSFGVIALLFGLTWNYFSMDDIQNRNSSTLADVEPIEYKSEKTKSVNARSDADVNTSVSNENIESDRQANILVSTTDNISDNAFEAPPSLLSRDVTINSVVIQSKENEILVSKIDQLEPLPLSSLEFQHELHLAETKIIDLTPFRRFEVGITASGGNSWLFNNDVRNGFNENSLIQNKLSTGYGLGIEAIVNFNYRNSIYFGYDAISVNHQNYSFYESGRLIDKRITLSQQKALIGYKFSSSDRKDNRKNYVIRTGLFYSHSISSETSLGSESKSVSSNYESFDYGLNLGGGIEHKFNRLKLEYGLKSDIGINNLTQSTVKVPKKFDYANSLFLGAYISLRYQF
jgi:hypothetical protein